MSYIDRIRDFIYTSPSGQEFKLLFDSLNRTGGKKAPVTEFPGQNQGAVQDLGNITPTFPVSCYISGADYDLEADRFWEALHEDGPGRLDHPRWGNVNVLPIPESQTEQFVDGAGRAVFQITFIRADEKQFEYPSVSIDYPTQVSASVDDFSDLMSSELPAEITDTKSISALKELYLDTIGKVADFFDNIANVADNVKAELYQAIRDIENQIDELVTEPARMLRAMLRVYRIIGQAIETVDDIRDLPIQEKLQAYKDIYTSIITGFKETSARYGQEFNLTNIANLHCLSIANSEAAAYGDINTRNEASEIITKIDEFSKLVREDIQNLESIASIQSSYDLALQVENITAQIISGLIDSALDLPTERTEVLDREVTPIKFVFEKYGDLERLDFFIEYNNLCCNNIILMPRGLEVRYYFE